MPFQTHNPRLSDVWTDERIILLLRLDAENKMSRSEIANELHRITGSAFTRNAVIGKLGRLGAPRKERKTRIPNMIRLRIAQRERLKIRPDPAPPPKPLEPSLMLSIYDLTETTCRYPSGAGGPPFEYCGHPIERGSYCAAHYRLCYCAPKDPAVSHRARVMNARRYKETLLKPACEPG